jgi:hypothetical protein
LETFFVFLGVCLSRTVNENWGYQNAWKIQVPPLFTDRNMGVYRDHSGKIERLGVGRKTLGIFGGVGSETVFSPNRFKNR